MAISKDFRVPRIPREETSEEGHSGRFKYGFQLERAIHYPKDVTELTLLQSPCEGATRNLMRHPQRAPREILSPEPR